VNWSSDSCKTPIWRRILRAINGGDMPYLLILLAGLQQVVISN
jgi:hypothetical protein